MVFISPKTVLVDFMRVNLTDPRARAEASTTEEFNGGGKTFTLSAPSGAAQCIILVTVTGTTQTKWKDYYWDQQNQKIIFFSNTAGGTDNVDITYKYGATNWVYPDKAKKPLGSTSFPRMNVLSPGGTGERLGQYNSDVESAITFQIDIWTKENYTPTISLVIYEGDKLSEYLAYEVTRIFRAGEDDLHPALYNYTILGTPRDMGFDPEMQSFHKIVEVEMKGINVGEPYT